MQQYSIGYGIEASDASNPTTLILTNEGNNGYESGGGVAKALADTGGTPLAVASRRIRLTAALAGLPSAISARRMP